MKLDESQELIKGRTKEKFLVKILKCLEYVDEHPEYADIVGISWSRSHDHIASNSKKLAAFLGVKSSTLNVNFRMFGMTITSCTGNVFANEFPEISDPRNWVKRCYQNQ